ncbi:MAG: hypothetical protein ACOC3V_04685 [bacterium]
MDHKKILLNILREHLEDNDTFSKCKKDFEMLGFFRKGDENNLDEINIEFINKKRLFEILKENFEIVDFIGLRPIIQRI